ncbi:hypothetical protein EC991_010139 [Linnemannia zychae]|nr:hypothetical protein EC991_010139 [Linnemannia zychae]
MNHETKEVILKVTDVVKTVVHFGFIPFVIYLGAIHPHDTKQLEQGTTINKTATGTIAPLAGYLNTDNYYLITVVDMRHYTQDEELGYWPIANISPEQPTYNLYVSRFVFHLFTEATPSPL